MTAAKYLCLKLVTASSATMRSSTWDPSRLAGKQGGVHVPPAATTPFPSATSPTQTTQSVLSELKTCGLSRCRDRLQVTDVGDCPFFRAGDRIRLHTVAHIVQDPLWLARKRCGVPFAAAATTAFPSATPPILSTSCAVGAQHSRLGKSSVETCAKTFGSDKCKCISRQSILSARPCAALFPANPSGVRVCNSERTRSGIFLALLL